MDRVEQSNYSPSREVTTHAEKEQLSTSFTPNQRQTSDPNSSATLATTRNQFLKSNEKQLNLLSEQKQNPNGTQQQRKLDNSRNQSSEAISSLPIANNSGESRRLIDDVSSGGCGCCCCCSSSLTHQTGKTMPSSMRLILACFLAELVGTFLLVVIGDGAVAAYTVTNKPTDVFAVCLAFGVGAMIATFVAAKISGAHINPAASLALALDGQLKWRLLPVYLCAQYVGGFLAASVLYLNYSEAIAAKDGGIRSAYGAGGNSTGAIFATYPETWVSVWGALLDQVIGTAILIFSLTAIGDKNNSGLEERHQPIIVALTICLVCVAFSPNCGAIFNPARDLAPRLLSYLVGYKTVWKPLNGFYWFVAGILGPHIGAILGLFGYKLLIGSSLSLRRESELDLSKDYNGQQEKHRNHSIGGKFTQPNQSPHSDSRATTNLSADYGSHQTRR